MVLTVTEDTPADMLAGSMELLVQIPRDQYLQTHRVTVQRSTPMMDLLVQIATAHKLAASSYTLQAIGERGLVLSHQPNTPIGALDALQVKLLPKQGSFLSRKNRQTNQPFETTFRLQVHLPRNQLYVSRMSPKTNLGEILDEVCREKNLDRTKYELRHPVNIAETLDLSLSLADYQIQEVNLYPRQQPSSRTLSSQDIMALQRQEETRRQQQQQSSRHHHHHHHHQQHHHHGVFSFMFKHRSKDSSVSTDSIGNRSVSPARSDETGRSSSPSSQQQQQQQQSTMQQQQQKFVVPLPSRPLRKRRQAPKPPTVVATQQQQIDNEHNNNNNNNNKQETTKQSSSSDNEITTNRSSSANNDNVEKIVISHSRNSSDSSGYHEASVLSDNPDNVHNVARTSETLPRNGRTSGSVNGRMQGIIESSPRKLALTSQASKSLSNLAMVNHNNNNHHHHRISGAGDCALSRGVSITSLSSTGQRKKRAAPPPPIARPLPSAISVQGLERIVDSDESLTSDMELSKPSSDIDAATGSSQASSDIACHVRPIAEQKQPESIKLSTTASVVDNARLVKKERAPPIPKPTSSAPQTPIERNTPICRPNSLTIASCSVSCPATPLSNNYVTHGLPSLTEDEREEINMAIDSIYVAATGHSPSTISLVSEYDDKKEATDDAIKSERLSDASEVTRRDGSEGGVETVVENRRAINEPEKSEPIVLSSTVDDTTISSLSPSRILTNAPIDEPESKIVPRTPSNSESRDNNVPNDTQASETIFPAKQDPMIVIVDEPIGTSCKIVDALLKSNNSPRSVSSPEPRTSISEFAQPAEDDHASTVLGSEKPTSIPAAPTDTDILLQRVSDTLLSQTLVPNTSETMNGATNETVTKIKKQAAINAVDDGIGCKGQEESTVIKKKPISVVEDESEEDDERPTTTATSSEDGSAQNLTVASQQDTSDYVSASGEDLSIGDWEYQIPAPPSAFRDDSDAELAAPVNKDSISIEAEVHHNSNIIINEKTSTKPSTTSISSRQQQRKRSSTSLVLDTVDFAQPKPPKPITPTCHNDAELKKAEVISELETKINHKPLSLLQNTSIAVVAARDDNYAPKIAPVENNLSNFTITTYSRPRNIDIFGAIATTNDKRSTLTATMDNDTRGIPGGFATLGRGRSLTGCNNNEDGKRTATLKGAVSVERVSAPLVDERSVNNAERHETQRDKPVHRSKSYIVLASNEKFQNKTNEIVDDDNDDEKITKIKDNFVNNGDTMTKKYTSLANVNVTSDVEIPRKEKFSQWRDNILKRQEDQSPEKQLQSLQVLKSILPHLKNAQATETNNYSKTNSDSFSTRERQEPQRDQPRDVSPVTTTEVKLRPTAQQSRNNNPELVKKRYTYGGPPSISLGSWSERPSLNVQIKSDTDYKLGGSALSGARTVVNLNSEPTSRDERKEEPTVVKTTATTTATTVKTIPVQLKQTPVPINAKEITEKEKDEPSVDTSSVNFRELAKAFGQGVRVRPKPPVTVRTSQQRRSEYIERNNLSSVTNDCTATSSIANFGHNDNRAVNGNNPTAPAVKRYTSVVGITNNNEDDAPSQQTSFRYMNGQTKTVQQAPIVKTFNGVEKNNNASCATAPIPPTMPIITGVTLKSVNARPKSYQVPIQQDPRDQLLESIRNFGGREKLKKSVDKH